MKLAKINEYVSSGMLEVAIGDTEDCISEEVACKLTKVVGWTDDKKKYKEKMEFTEKLVNSLMKINTVLLDIIKDCDIKMNIKPSCEYGKYIYRATMESDAMKKLTIVVGAKNAGGKYCCYVDGSPIAECKASTLTGLINKIEKLDLTRV